MQNVHGKEIDLLRTTVKVPGKRPPRAVSAGAAGPSPKTNGLAKDLSGLQLGQQAAGETSCRRAAGLRAKAFYKLYYLLLLLYYYYYAIIIFIHNNYNCIILLSY